MFFRLRRWFSQSNFNRQISGIMKTPAIRLADKPWTIISMVTERDIPMYLLAMKSFYTRVGGGKIIAIIDRGLPRDSRRLLEAHFVGIEFKILEDIHVGRCQRGGTWERLLTLVDHSETEYAIQVDSDTLTFGNIDEIIDCIQQNRAFTLSGQTGSPIWTIEETIAAGNSQSDVNHCSIAFERALAHYPDPEGKRFVRGSSGLAGFARGGYGRAALEEFHVNMDRIMGARWKEWGTEQVGSCWVVANSPDPLVLPYPKYANFIPELQRGQSNFLHFIGTYRYDDGYFAGLGAAEIHRLMAAG